MKVDFPLAGMPINMQSNLTPSFQLDAEPKLAIIYILSFEQTDKDNLQKHLLLTVNGCFVADISSNGITNYWET